jgi:hypothetical protein
VLCCSVFIVSNRLQREDGPAAKQAAARGMKKRRRLLANEAEEERLNSSIRHWHYLLLTGPNALG